MSTWPEWRPITEAPRDGTKFLILRPSTGAITEVQHYGVFDDTPGFVLDPFTGKLWGAEWWLPRPSNPPKRKPKPAKKARKSR